MWMPNTASAARPRRPSSPDCRMLFFIPLFQGPKLAVRQKRHVRLAGAQRLDRGALAGRGLELRRVVPAQSWKLHRPEDPVLAVGIGGVEDHCAGVIE